MPERVAATNGSPAPREHGCDPRNLAASRRRPSATLSLSAMLSFEPVTTTPQAFEPLRREAVNARAETRQTETRELFSFVQSSPRAAARSRRTRLRTSACRSNGIRSAAATKPWVGRTQAVGHRVIPLDRINSATAAQYLSASLIKSSMFHTRAAGSVSQSLWLHFGVSPKILVKTETLDGLRAGFRRVLLPVCRVNP